MKEKNLQPDKINGTHTHTHNGTLYTEEQKQGENRLDSSKETMHPRGQRSNFLSSGRKIKRR